MIESQKIWQVSRPNIEVVEMLEKELSIPSVCAKVLASRGFENIEDAKSFLQVSENQLHNPFLFPGMEALVARVHQSVESEERIMVYGDYDADGITSTTIMVKALESLGADVIYKIPNRFIDGYGPSERLFQEAYDEGVKLIITVDNGISGIQPIEFAKGLGMDVIVTDHHEPGEILPLADIIIHPSLKETTYPFPHLAGVGVAFKVAHALLGEIPKEFYYLVATGTTFPVAEKTNDWYKVIVGDQTAYVASWVVSASSTTSSVKKDPENKVKTDKKKADRKKGTLKGLTIVVDAGHGGNDRGTTGALGTDEKDITLMTSELLSSKLQAAGANVILTRESDEYVDLRKRVSIGHQVDADAFISLHYDAIDNSSIRGFTTYYMHSYQKELATYVHNGLGNMISLKDRGTQPGDYLVLRENKQTAILIELGYLSNASEERNVTTQNYREQATHGIYNGIINYFNAQLD